jgi:hypothetical protein
MPPHHYMTWLQERAASMDGILDTVSAAHDLDPLMALLKVDSTLVMLGVPPSPPALPAGPLVFSECCNHQMGFGEPLVSSGGRLLPSGGFTWSGTYGTCRVLDCLQSGSAFRAPPLVAFVRCKRCCTCALKRALCAPRKSSLLTTSTRRTSEFSSQTCATGALALVGVGVHECPAELVERVT